VTTTIEVVAWLAELRAEREATAAALERAEAEIPPVEAALAEAQAVYDTAAAELGRAGPAYHGAIDGSGGTWSPRSADQEAEARAAYRLAEAALRQARDELEPRLVARTEAHKARSDLSMRGRMLDGLIEQAEAALERARGRAEPGRDPLAAIRQRLGVGRSDARP
jgi:hypothetical protein